MALKMSVSRAKHLLTLTGSVGQSKLLLTGFKRALWHGEGLSLGATNNQLYGVVLARHIVYTNMDILSGILDV